MNIVKLQRQLQSVPEQALVGYVQNPDGRVPSYLALTELSRRKQMREEYQKAAAPEKSVAESMVEEATGIAAIPQQMPQQMAPQMPPQMAQAPQPQAPMQMAEGGLAALSLPDDMFDEESYAGGGIVAFDEGGYVPPLTYDAAAEYRKARQAAEAERVRQTYGVPANQYYGAGVTDYARSPYDAALSYYAKQLDTENPQVSESYPAFQTLTARRNAWLKGQKDPYTREAPLGSKTNVPAAVVEQTTVPVQDRTGITQQRKEKVGDIGDSRTQDTDKAPRPSRNRFNELVFNPVTVDEAGYDQLMPKEQSMRDYAAEFRAELGDDPSRAAMKERLEGMRTKATKEEERAPWMALAEAGLGMAAGQSQFALQNIATGGIRGIQSYNEARDRLVKAEERRFDLENKVSQAERAEQLAAINYGADSKRYDDQNRRAVGLAKQADKARAAEVKAQGEYNAVKDKLTFQLEESKINLQAEANRIAKASNLAEKQRAMYEKALDNARADVIANAELTGTKGSMTEKDYNDAVYAKYLANLKSLGLEPLGGASGYSVLGVENPKPNKK